MIHWPLSSDCHGFWSCHSICATSIKYAFMMDQLRWSHDKTGAVNSVLFALKSPKRMVRLSLVLRRQRDNCKQDSVVVTVV